MIPLLFAAAVSLATPGLQEDLQGPIQRLLDAATPPPISKDLRGPAPTPFDGKSPYILKIAPGAVLSSDNKQQLYAGRFCQRKAVQTLGPDHGGLKKLGDLPPGLLEHAVNRLVDGCPVREIVSRGGVYYLDMQAASLERADPVSRVTKAPAAER